MLSIQHYKNRLDQICKELHLKKLDIFGSAATDKFREDSDVDIIVEFDKNDNQNLFDLYFTLKENLQKLFQRPSDIIIEGTIKNPYLKKSIEKTRKNLYAA